ncbi:MAG: hypothetical protein AAF467_20025 [Actinomycetota bacterium]
MTAAAIGGLAVVALVGWLALRDNAPGSGTATGVVVSTGDTSDPSTESTSTSTSTSPTTSGAEEPTTTTSGDTTTTTVTTTVAGGPVECSSGQYTLVVPEGWDHDGCARFSQSAFERPLPANLRPEIDIAWVTSETYDDALIRVRNRFEVQSEAFGAAGGRDAAVFVLTESASGGRTGERLVYVVDAPDGVFFASANELVNGVPVFGPRASHYQISVIALDEMMASLDF